MIDHVVVTKPASAFTLTVGELREVVNNPSLPDDAMVIVFPYPWAPQINIGRARFYPGADWGSLILCQATSDNEYEIRNRRGDFPNKE